MNQIAVSENKEDLNRMFNFIGDRLKKTLSDSLKHAPIKLKIASLFYPPLKPLSKFFSSPEGKRMIKVGTKTIEEGKNYLYNENGAYKDLKTGNIGHDIMNLTEIVKDLGKAM